MQGFEKEIEEIARRLLEKFPSMAEIAHSGANKMDKILSTQRQFGEMFNQEVAKYFGTTDYNQESIQAIFRQKAHKLMKDCHDK